MQAVVSIATINESNPEEKDAMSSIDAMAQTPPAENAMHVLGTVTDKIIVTPDFDIGRLKATRAASEDLSFEKGGILKTFKDEADTLSTIKAEQNF